MENIKLYEPVIYWQNGIIRRGRVLDIALKEEGMIFYVEDTTSHQMFTLTSEQITKE